MYDQRKRKKLSKAQRFQLYEKYNKRCAYCGCELDYNEMQVDHKIPVYLEGKDVLENYLPACRSCNLYKRTMTIEKFRLQLETLGMRMKRDSSNYRILLRYGLINEQEQKVRFYYEKLEEQK